MAKKPTLRAVEPDEKAPPKILTLSEAIEGGDYLQILLAQRRDIVSDLPLEKGPAKAALHRQLALLSKDIEGLQAAEAQEAENAEDTPDEEWDDQAI